MVAYLNEYSAEVRKMLSLEWNDEIYRKVLLEEGIEVGRERGREEGIEVGREEGIEVGREEGLLEVACNMKTDGEPVEKIARFTGLSEDTIEAL